MSSSNIQREMGRGMGLWKWLIGAQMAEPWSGGKSMGGAKEDEGQRWQLRGLPVRPSLIFRLDLQVLDGTLVRARLENKNRCHKTLLWLGFASVMTPLEMLSMMFTTKTCQIRGSEWYSSCILVFIIKLSAVLTLTCDGKQLFLSSQHNDSLYKYPTVLSLLAKSKLHLYKCDTLLFMTHLVKALLKYSWKCFYPIWAWGVYKFSRPKTDRLAHLNCPDTIKHVSYLWPDICRVLNKPFSVWRSQIQHKGKSDSCWKP